MGLIMLDLDGTLVESSLVSVDGKLQPAPGVFSEPVLLPNRLEVLSRAAQEGDSFAIVTNQGGVAWGYVTPAEVYARIGRAVALLHGFCGRPFSIHVCFAHPKATIAQYREGHERRKPAPAMLREALGAHRVDLSSSRAEPGPDGAVEFYPAALMVGDLDGDAEAAKAAGVSFVHADDFFA